MTEAKRANTYFDFALLAGVQQVGNRRMQTKLQSTLSTFPGGNQNSRAKESCVVQMSLHPMKC
jgi:hypothetical protein